MLLVIRFPWAMGLLLVLGSVLGAPARAQTYLAVIAQYSLPYYASIQDVGIAPPVGQFAANAHLCMKNAVVNWNGRRFLQFFIQGRGAVYAAFNLEAVPRDPAGDKECESIAAQSPTQSKGLDQGTGDAMAATGEASAPTPLAVITQTVLPYFASPQAVNSKPLGQFAFHTQVCITGKTYTWNRLRFFQYVLPSGELVYTLTGKGIFARDPVGDKNCMSQVASTTLPANIPPPVQRAPQTAPQTPTATASPDIAGTITSANDPSMRADIETDARVMQEGVRAQVDSLFDSGIASANKNNCDSAREDVAKIPDLLKKAKIDISLMKDRHTAIETEMQNKMVEILGSIQACDMRASAERKAPPPSPEPTGSSPQTTLAMIAESGFPYSASPQDIYNNPPLGEFKYNMHLCVKRGMSTWGRLKFLQFILPSGDVVYSEDRYVGGLTRNPAGDKNCELMAHQSEIKLKADHQRQITETASAAQHPTWTDPSTGLMWATKDNGSDVTLQEAGNYCQNLTLGGYSGWRLPTIDELQGIYDPSIDLPGHFQSATDITMVFDVTYHVKGNLNLSGPGWQWSSSPGGTPGDAWAFLFSTHGRRQVIPDSDWGKRALCVRRSGK